MSVKLLYVSGYHPTLEHDDLDLFSELGIDWFSTGIYMDPASPFKQVGWRDNIQKTVDDALLYEFKLLNPNHKTNSYINLSKNFVDNFDVILINFSFLCQRILDDIWDKCKHKLVIYRTYCQQFSDFELKLRSYKKKGLKILRVSERESTLKSYAGHDGIISGFVDKDIYKGWTGGISKVLTFANDFPARINHPNFDCYRAYLEIKKHIPYTLHGMQSEFVGGGGFLPWKDQLSLYNNHNAYLALPSPPSTATYNFVEAWVSGIPVITFGEELGNGVGYRTWEPPYVIENGVDGFFSDDLDEIIKACCDIIEDKDLQKQFSECGREKCISIYGKEVIKNKWIEFFNSLGVNL